MIHPQVRREGAPSPAGHVASTEATEVAPAAADVPRQHTREHPDAYDLYAQIYALRTDLPGDASV
jgi:hypothetical protein